MVDLIDFCYSLDEEDHENTQPHVQGPRHAADSVVSCVQASPNTGDAHCVDVPDCGLATSCE